MVTRHWSLAALLLTGAPLAAQTPQRFAGVRAFIERQIVERGLPSVGVAVAKDGKIVWEEGFGWADRERMIPATAHTPYSLASISKPFTATGLMRLVEEGRIALDRPANDYLGGAKLTGLAGDASQATVRRVASHTAGLPLHYEFFYEGLPYRERSMDEAIARYAIMVIPPGRVWLYSNLGYGVIDEIIGRVSGMAYGDYMRARVFVPLGMTRTSVHLTPELKPYAAVRYDARHRPVPYYDFDHDGGSAVYASPHDLVRFGLFHLKNHLPDQRAILADSTIEAMQRPQTPEGSEPAYGLGWLVYPNDRGFLNISHTGGMPGVATILSLYPTENLAVVVLLNFSDGEARVRITEEIVGAVLPSYAAARRDPTPPVTPPPFQAPPELRGEWSGTLRTYEGTVPFVLTVRENDVHARIADQPEAVLDRAAFRFGALTGRLAATITTADARRHAHQITLGLWLRDGVLSGQASALTTTDPVYFALSSYVELRKAR